MILKQIFGRIRGTFFGEDKLSSGNVPLETQLHRIRKFMFYWVETSPNTMKSIKKKKKKKLSTFGCSPLRF